MNEIKKALAAILCFTLIASTVILNLSVSSESTDLFTATFETEEEVKPNSGYYCGTSNAASYRLDEAGYKFENYDKLSEETKTGGHVTIPVVGEGIGNNASDGAIRLAYENNIEYSSKKFNPAFSLRNPAANGSFKPEQGKIYKITLYYKTESIKTPVSLWMGQQSGALTNLSISEANVTNPVKITDINETGGYIKAEQYVTGAGGNLNLLIFMTAENYADCSPASVLIDDITVSLVATTTITFETNGGSSVASMSGIPGTQAEVTAVPNKAGFEFGGWFTNEECTVPFDGLYPASDITVYAKWTEIENVFGTQDFEDLEDLSGFSLRNDWELSEAYNHTPEGGKSAAMRIDKEDNSEMGRPRMVINIGGVNTVVKRGNSYTVSFWLYLPESEASSITLKYYVASIASPDKVTSDNKPDHKIEGTGEISTGFAAGAWQQFIVEIPSLEGIAENNYLEIGLTDDMSWIDGYKSRSLYIDDISVTENEAGEIQTEYGPQDYEEIAVENYPQSNTDGIRGNGSGREVSDEQNHTENGSHSVKLNMNDNRETNAPRTVVNFDGADFRVRTNTAYQITFWAYSPENLSVTYRLGTSGSTTNLWINPNWTEALQTVEMKAGEWQEIKFTVLSFSASNYLTLAATFDEASADNAKPLYIDDVIIRIKPETPSAPKVIAQTQNSVTLESIEGMEYSINGVDFQDSNVFENLSAGSTYAFYQRVKATATAMASDISEPTEYYIAERGDVNGDTEINTLDLTLLKQYLLGVEGEYICDALDVNGDSSIDVKDFVRLKKLIAYPEIFHKDDSAVSIG